MNIDVALLTLRETMIHGLVPSKKPLSANIVFRWCSMRLAPTRRWSCLGTVLVTTRWFVMIERVHAIALELIVEVDVVLVSTAKLGLALLQLAQVNVRNIT
ncbi:hypothetical protein SAMD00019534_078080 [Acytostelium subglobosum LB1]|uniref:hypothetical protein n=1 Tax=Acytostelium subglobosum LB1 TaxID=1410327 RepID=UPI0006449099|nr:hypothetical protein SAMD00019534_078080 [Acytostelium subglobosum LB1]GAM24633.1 hypothetical protein SAMD00019534_078080 [Acytostelium subglobosum LB1]|eukprot:XP_012752302.1 hypothetical protein SAMD00019534_078080 [Acytostelium subglobosum LB1]